MTTLPTQWATRLNYSTGPDNGTPTKVDPASAANGFIRGTAAAAQAVNFLLSAQGSAARRALSADALRLTEARLTGSDILDANDSLAAAAIGEGYPIVAAKTAQAFSMNDSGRFNVLGTPLSIVSSVSAAACNPATGRILLAGAGPGNGGFTYSDDSGETWTAGAAGAVSVASNGLVWNAVKGKFIAYSSTTALRSADGSAAWSSGTISNDASGGLAVLSNGNTVACGDGAAVAFSISSDGGATWSDASGTIANAGSAGDAGSLCGNGGDKIYHLSRQTGLGTFQVSSSLDGSSWAAGKTFVVPNGAGMVRGRILMCQNTGILVALMPFTAAVGTQVVTAMSFSFDGSQNWSDLLYAHDAPIASFAVAGGRLLHTRGTQLFLSAGVGWS